jgi:dTDP-4-dehydrorhamnose reductase
MKLLILGANSYVGARLFFDLHKDHDCVGTYHSNPLSRKFLKLDITNQGDVDRLITDQQPDYIIHAANNADARWCEAHPKEAELVNQTATEFILSAAKKASAKIIYISSFANTGVYGKTKAASTDMVKSHMPGFVIIVPGFILGYSPNTVNDRPFNRILANLDKGTPAIYDTSWKLQMTYLRHISEVMHAVIKKSILNESITVAVPGLTTRFECARDILRPLGISVTPTDKHDTTPSEEHDLQRLRDLSLPQHTYQEAIESIIGEIRNRQAYTL